MDSFSAVLGHLRWHIYPGPVGPWPQPAYKQSPATPLQPHHCLAVTSSLNLSGLQQCFWQPCILLESQSTSSGAHSRKGCHWSLSLWLTRHLGFLVGLWCHDTSQVIPGCRMNWLLACSYALNLARRASAELFTGCPAYSHMHDFRSCHCPLQLVFNQMMPA